ncbi:4'-phosphopantetheinyl transferase family protein [Nocardiopsis algeriensis]|uniref:4'-phosphopantetheinyl transferase family protein n=1 Tax=Nocardiopsis algeriensis TaxID=1478215 RepID=UPI003B42C122
MSLSTAPLAPEVWWAHTSDAHERLLRLLDGQERARNDRFLRKPDRDRHLLGRALARLVLAERAGCAPEEVSFSLRCRSCEEKESAGAERTDGEPHGKPHPEGPARGWEFSVSHSGEWVVLALAEGVPLGVDVERVSEGRDLEGLASYTLGGPELEAWRALGPDERAGAFFGYWSRKEALLKATGHGLSGGLSRVLVSPPHERASLLEWTGVGAPEAVSITDLDRGGEYRAALAALNDRPLRPVVHPPGVAAALLRGAPVSPARPLWRGGGR